MQSNTKGNLILAFLFLLCVLLAFTGFVYMSCMLASICLSAYTARFGPKTASVLLATIFIASMFLHNLFWPLYLLPPFLVGCFIFFKGTFSGMLMSTTLLQTAVLTVHTLSSCRQQGKTPAEFLFADATDTFFNMVSASGQVELAVLEEMEVIFRFVLQTMQGMLPFLYLTASLLLSYLLFVLLRFLLKRAWKQEIAMPYFHELWLPKGVSITFAILFILSFFTASPILANMVSFLFTLHVFCGISVIDFYLRAKGMSGALRALLLAGILAMSSFLGGITTSILCCVGMSDNGRGIRK